MIKLKLQNELNINMVTKNGIHPFYFIPSFIYYMQLIKKIHFLFLYFQN